MEEMTKKRGQEYLPKIWNLFISKNDSFSPESFSCRKIRYRCIFRLEGDSLILYFHLTDSERKKFDLKFISSHEDVNVFGAYNQYNVCQLKSSGSIREMNKDEKCSYLKDVQGRLNGIKRCDKLPLKPSPEEKREVLQLLKNGTFFRFEPYSYHYGVFERG